MKTPDVGVTFSCPNPGTEVFFSFPQPSIPPPIPSVNAPSSQKHQDATDTNGARVLMYILIYSASVAPLAVAGVSESVWHPPAKYVNASINRRETSNDGVENKLVIFADKL